MSKSRITHRQFSLRQMFAVVLVVAVMAACIAVFLRWQRDAADLRRALAESGAYHLPSESYIEFDTQATDESLAVLTYFPEINDVLLNSTKVTDAGLARLEPLQYLLRVGLRDTMISDAGLAYLKDLTYLESLDLADTKVSDAGLRYLAGKKRLQWLQLENTRVTGVGFKFLVDCRRLEIIWIDPSQTSEEALQNLRKIPNLQGVRIVGDVTDEELESYRAVLKPIGVSRASPE